MLNIPYIFIFPKSKINYRKTFYLFPKKSSPERNPSSRSSIWPSHPREFQFSKTNLQAKQAPLKEFAHTDGGNTMYYGNRGSFEKIHGGGGEGTNSMILSAQFRRPRLMAALHVFAYAHGSSTPLSSTTPSLPLTNSAHVRTFA